MDITRLHQETGAAWNETALKYERDEERSIAFLLDGGNDLLEVERLELGRLDWCKRAIHLQCAAGTDTLSLLNQGAVEVVGVDISERMIACAKRKTAALKAKATWHCSDILATPAELDGTADLVYTGKGAICWMMDIAAWARVVSRLLKPGGLLYVFEGHPLDWVWETNATDYQFREGLGFFSEAIDTGYRWPGPFLKNLDKPGVKELHANERQWTFGPILNSLTQAGLRLERFEEHPEAFWNQFPNIPPNLLHRLPHTFSLKMRKPER
jgi:SAM-dependent methyltransferase